MNKKIIALIIAIIVIAGGVGIWLISSNNNSDTNNVNSNANINENKLANTEENTADGDNTGNMEASSSKKVGIVYFSATGTTRKVAEYIKELTGGDLIEIEPKQKYTDDDLNWNDNNSRTTMEQNDPSVRPEIANNIDTNSYDVIYLGYPIWWGDAPRIILTFLDKSNLNGKTVIPFCTSGSSGIDTSVNYLKSNYKNINWLDGKRLSISQSEIKAWVDSLNY